MKPEKSSSMGWFSTERGQWSEDFGILGQFLGFHHGQHPKKQSITTSSIDLQPIPNQSPRQTCKQKDHVGSVLLQVQLSSELLSSSLWCVVVVQWKHVVRVAAGFQGSPYREMPPRRLTMKTKFQELNKNNNIKHWNLRELRFKPQKCTLREVRPLRTSFHQRIPKRSGDSLWIPLAPKSKRHRGFLISCCPLTLDLKARGKKN